MDTALPQKFPFILYRNLAKANCTGNRVCTSCDTVVLDLHPCLPFSTAAGERAKERVEERFNKEWKKGQRKGCGCEMAFFSQFPKERSFAAERLDQIRIFSAIPWPPKELEVS